MLDKSIEPQIFWGDRYDFYWELLRMIYEEAKEKAQGEKLIEGGGVTHVNRNRQQ